MGLAHGTNDFNAATCHNSDLMKAFHLLRNCSDDRSEGSSGGTSSEPALNLAAALDRVGGDEELMRELAALFIDDYPRQMQLIDEAIAKEDWRTAERESHGLKGAVANFGAAEAVEAARKMEFAAREGRYSELPELREQVRRELARVRVELDRLMTR